MGSLLVKAQNEGNISREELLDHVRIVEHRRSNISLIFVF